MNEAWRKAVFIRPQHDASMSRVEDEEVMEKWYRVVIAADRDSN